MKSSFSSERSRRWKRTKKKKHKRKCGFPFGFCFVRLQAKNRRTKVVIIFVPLIKSANYNYFFIVICTLFGFHCVIWFFRRFSSFYAMQRHTNKHFDDNELDDGGTMVLLYCMVNFYSYECTIIYERQYYVTYMLYTQKRFVYDVRLA